MLGFFCEGVVMYWVWDGGFECVNRGGGGGW